MTKFIISFSVVFFSLVAAPLTVNATGDKKPSSRGCSHLLISDKLTLPARKPEFQFKISVSEANSLMKGDKPNANLMPHQLFTQVIPSPAVVKDMLGSQKLGVEVTIRPKGSGSSVNILLYYPDQWKIVSADEVEVVSLMGGKSPRRFNLRVWDQTAATIFFRALRVPKILEAALIQAESPKHLDDFSFNILSDADPNLKIEAEYSVSGDFEDHELDLFLNYLAYALYSRTQGREINP
jgi:hypothetical protein